jgi:hypothetical protein
MPRTKLRKGLTQTSKEEGGSTSRTTAQIEKYYSGGKRPISYKKNDRGKIVKIKMLTGGQAKIAAKAPPPNKIDEKDFAVLRAEKAKGRGMGLQDESVKPGKVQKAALGMLALGIGAKKLMDKNGKGLPPGLGAAALLTKKKKDILGMGGGAVLMPQDRRNQTTGLMPQDRKNKTTGPILKPQDKMGGGMMKKYSKGGGADSGRIGEMKSRLAVAADRVGGFRKGRGKISPENLLRIKEQLKKAGKTMGRMTESDLKTASSLVKKKMGGGMMQKPMGYKKGKLIPSKKSFDKVLGVYPLVKKKMGGGMVGSMQRPMAMSGYKKGTMVKARGCKLGRTRPTKIT